MEKRPDIFYKLKDHSSPPPPDMIDRVRDALALGDAEGLQRLQEHAVNPPPQLKQAIIQKLSKTRRSRYTNFYRYAAAACVLLIAGGLLVYNLSSGKHTGQAKQFGIVPQTQSTKTHIDSTNAANQDTNAIVPKEAPAPSSVAENGSLSLSLSIDGEKYPVTGNNLLATFTSYEYPAVRQLLEKTNSAKGLNVRLDHYTHISLSRTMTAMLRDCYGTRPDGSPAQKAKKTRQLLQKWSDQDRKQFAMGFMSNPLDVVDLAQFLFPPVFSFRRHVPAPIPAAGEEAAWLPIPASENKSLTVSYALTIQTRKSSAGIGETYNGGMQTLFDAGHHARLRLASLMRIQSVIFNRGAKSFTIVTESSRPQQQAVLNLGQWSAYNGKYAQAVVKLKDDTLSLLGYVCRKAIIRLHDGGEITAWYTPDLKSASQSLLQPAFAGLLGLVLKYEYTCRRTTVQYTASSVSRGAIDPSVFNSVQE